MTARSTRSAGAARPHSHETRGEAETGVYTTRLVGPVTIAPVNTNQLLYTVPAGKVAIVRNITVLNNSTTLPATVRVGIGLASVGANRVLRVPMPADSSDYRETRIALVAGESLYAFVGTGDSPTVTLQMTGYVFNV